MDVTVQRLRVVLLPAYITHHALVVLPSLQRYTPSAVFVPSSSFELHPMCGYDYTGGTTINRNSISFFSCSATCSAPSTSVLEEFSTRSFAKQAAACTPDLTWWTCTCFAAYPATSLMPSCTVTPTISILFLVSPASSRAPTLALTSSSGHLLVKRSRT